MTHQHTYDRITRWCEEPKYPMAVVRVEIACECGATSIRLASDLEVEDRVGPAYCPTCEDYFVNRPHQGHPDCIRYLKSRHDNLERRFEELLRTLRQVGG